MGVYLYLSPADSCVIGNALPPAATIWEGQRRVAVTGENQHQDVLAAFATAAGARTRVWATLPSTLLGAGRTPGQPTIEVRMDGNRVGVLAATPVDCYGETVIDAGSSPARPP